MIPEIATAAFVAGLAIGYYARHLFLANWQQCRVCRDNHEWQHEEHEDWRL